MNEAKPRGPIAIDSVPWDVWNDGVRYGSRVRVLSDTHGADKRKIGISIEELAPGKQSCPFHYHTAEEEHIIALDGEATLRLGGERYQIKAGDYVAFPAGQRLSGLEQNKCPRAARWRALHSAHRRTPRLLRWRKERRAALAVEFTVRSHLRV